MNRSDIRTLVIAHTNRSDKVTLINSMIDAALKKVSSVHSWRDLRVDAYVNTVANQEYVELASDMRRLSPDVRWMDGLSSYKNIVRPKSFLVRMWPDFSAQSPSKPRFGYLEGKLLYLVPPPSEVMEIRYSYFKRHAGLSDDTTDLTPSIIDEAVIAYATYRVFKSIQQHEDAVAWFADFTAALQDAKTMDRHSAIERQATPRGMGRPVSEDYYIDPFVKEAP